MKHASLFTGIGGFDLAAQWMGWENIFQVEIDKYCNKVLEKNFPKTTRYGDIKEFDGTKYRGTIDVLSGGFPCQPYSLAGKRMGQDDERHLWPEMLRIIREVQPVNVLGENVFGIVNWSKGLVFEQVQADLEVEGFEVQTFIIPACAVNAPHRRDRVWFVAHSDRNRQSVKSINGFSRLRELGNAANTKNNGCERQNGCDNRNEWGILPKGYAAGGESLRCCEADTDTNNQGMERRKASGHIEESRPHSDQFTGGLYKFDNWKNFPVEPPVCGRNDGISNRVDRIKALGNAIVPQVAFQIFKALQQMQQ